MNPRIIFGFVVLPLCATTVGQPVQIINFEDYSVGSVGGQHGWTSTALIEPQISNEHPYWGQQHLRVSADENLPPGQRMEAVGPTAYFPPNVNWGFLYGQVSFSDSYPRTTYDVLSRGRDGLLTAGLRFAPDRQILVLAGLGDGLAVRRRSRLDGVS